MFPKHRACRVAQNPCFTVKGIVSLLLLTSVSNTKNYWLQMYSWRSPLISHSLSCSPCIRLKTEKDPMHQSYHLSKWAALLSSATAIIPLGDCHPRHVQTWWLLHSLESSSSLCQTLLGSGWHRYHFEHHLKFTALNEFFLLYAESRKFPR